MLGQWAASSEWLTGDSIDLRLRRRLRRLLLKVVDPVVRYPIQDYVLELRLSHEMPRYRRLFPTYDRPLEDVIAALRATEVGLFRAIDVGANIGDSTLALLKGGADAVLCVEGVDQYLNLLSRNVRAYGDRVEVARSFLTETAQPVASRAARGSAVVGEGGPTDVKSLTFAELLSAHPAFSEAQLLKIDTDGWDQAVLASASDWLARQQPAVFFELDPALQRDQGYDAAGVWPLLGPLGYRFAHLWSNVGQPVWNGDLSEAAAASTVQLSRFPYLDVLVTRAHISVG